MKGKAKKNLLISLILIVTVGLAVYILRSVEGFSKSPTVDLVVARYKEDLSWLQKYMHLPFRTIYIYNKSDQPIQCIRPKNCKVISIPNVGVCDQTYLYHIIHNYSSLADFTVFLPGSGNLPNKTIQVEKIVNGAFQGKAQMVGYVLDKPVHQAYDSFQVKQYLTNHSSNQDDKATNLTPADVSPFGNWYRHYFPTQNDARISYLGIFCLTRQMIQKNPKSKYEKYDKLLNKDKLSETAHFMERSWASLFPDIPPENLVKLTFTAEQYVDSIKE